MRIFFLSLCTLGGFAVSQVRPELINHGSLGVAIGFGLGGLLIAIDEMLKGFSLRAFSAASFGLLLGTLIAWLLDQSGLFSYAREDTQWIIRLVLFLAFGYIGIILAMRSNKEDFYLIIPFVRFAAQNKPENLLLLDTSAIIDGRVAGLLDGNFLDGILVVPRFVLAELQQLADSDDPTKRARGRRGLELLSRWQRNPRREVKIHEADLPQETGVDAKLVRLARTLGAKLLTTDYNLGKIAELQAVDLINISELANALKPSLAAGEIVNLKIVREGKEKGQGIGYLNDGTMVVVNHAQALIGQQAEVHVLGLHQTGAGVIVFGELRKPAPPLH
ncbi:MAG: TRAM domain-containing protein [Pedosphaera parvula]|nr:TRAM domain-containing protein [Pedosphaera parvula]